MFTEKKLRAIVRRKKEIDRIYYSILISPTIFIHSLIIINIIRLADQFLDSRFTPSILIFSSIFSSTLIVNFMGYIANYLKTK